MSLKITKLSDLKSVRKRDAELEWPPWRCRYCGPTYAKATKKRLMGMVYDHLTGKWVDDED